MSHRGILGLTGFGHWGYAAARAGYSFVRSRQGSPLDHSARLRAYVGVRHALGADESLTPSLRNELIRRVDGLGGNRSIPTGTAKSVRHGRSTRRSPAT